MFDGILKCWDFESGGILKLKDIRRRDFERQDFKIGGILSGEIFGFDGILSATEFLRVTEY